MQKQIDMCGALVVTTHNTLSDSSIYLMPNTHLTQANQTGRLLPLIAIFMVIFTLNFKEMALFTT